MLCFVSSVSRLEVCTCAWPKRLSLPSFEMGYQDKEKMSAWRLYDTLLYFIPLFNSTSIPSALTGRLPHAFKVYRLIT